MPDLIVFGHADLVDNRNNNNLLKLIIPICKNVSVVFRSFDRIWIVSGRLKIEKEFYH